MPLAALKTPPFPGAYPDPLSPDPKLQKALNDAIATGPGPAWRTPVSIVALADTRALGAHPAAHFKGSEVHFSASLLKIAAMYAAFELRGVLRNIAVELGSSTTQARLLEDAAAYLEPKILAKAAALPALKGVQRTHALPTYAAMFDVVPLAPQPGFTVNFTSAYATHMERMIAVSDNACASQCVHGSGYGYLNGALASAGFFDPVKANGVWLAGDYTSQYPYFRIQSVNDGLVAQAATTLHLARMYALLHDGKLVGGVSSGEMLELLAKAVAVPEVFIDRASGLDFDVVYTKVGLGPLKRENGALNVYSEGSILQHRATGRRFVAVWQNLVIGDDGFDPIGHVVRDTINAYLSP